MRTEEQSQSSTAAWAGRAQSEQRRERVLTVVENREPPLSLSDLVDAVADREASARGDVDPDRVLVRLHHVDLPKLDERGALEYDPSGNVVSECSAGE